MLCPNEKDMSNIAYIFKKAVVYLEPGGVASMILEDIFRYDGSYNVFEFIH